LLLHYFNKHLNSYSYNISFCFKFLYADKSLRQMIYYQTIHQINVPQKESHAGNKDYHE